MSHAGTGRLARSWPPSQDRAEPVANCGTRVVAGPRRPTFLFDEFADLFVDGFVRRQGRVREAGGFGVGRTGKSDARVRVDDFVAGRPPGAVVDRARRLVSSIQFAE